ncbi:MAG: trypsin-like peptidase domain-containing protein [Chloroflexi bacterium]|nr:trypsin-like peptidase domain-containing protein [Chloroflexota bacterium]
MSEHSTGATDELAALSDALANAVATAGAAVVRVEARRRQAASGVVWSEGGIILTADHVLERDEDLAVGLPDGREVPATVIGRDPGSDLALLRVDAATLAPINRGPLPRVGHLVLIVARPGEGLATSIGVVSAFGGPARIWRGGRLDSFIRTDASFHPGFSGSPLVDAPGRMVGLATSFGGRGAGLAIPLAVIDRVTAALLQHGRVRRGVLGISSQPVAMPAGLTQPLNLAQETGLLVVGVEADGPGGRGGLLIGDILVGLAGQPVRDTEDLRVALGPESVGQAVRIRVVRGGELRELSVTVGERQ